MKAILTLCLLLSMQIFAQEDLPQLKLRHIKGFKGIDLSYGFNKGGNYFGLGYTQFLTNVYTVNPILRYETTKIDLTRIKEYTLLLSFQRNIVNLQDVFYIFAGLGPCIQLQQTENKILGKTETYTPYGFAVDINLELFILNNLSLKAEFSEIYSVNDHFGNFRYFIAPGIRIYLN